MHFCFTKSTYVGLALAFVDFVPVVAEPLTVETGESVLSALEVVAFAVVVPVVAAATFEAPSAGFALSGASSLGRRCSVRDAQRRFSSSEFRRLRQPADQQYLSFRRLNVENNTLYTWKYFSTPPPPQEKRKLDLGFKLVMYQYILAEILKIKKRLMTV